MKFARRQFLRLSLSSSSLLLSSKTLAGALSFASPQHNSYSALPAWLDTLLPATATSPGAKALGSHKALLDKAKQSAPYANILRKGCQWLDHQANAVAASNFAYLNEAQRIAITQQAERLSLPQLPKVFFILSHHDAMCAYYSDPRSWPPFGISSPPQPNGFIHQAKPPRHV